MFDYYSVNTDQAKQINNLTYNDRDQMITNV